MTSRVMKTVPLNGAMPVYARRAIYASAVTLGLLVAGLLWFAIARPVQVLPRMRQAPSFTLTDERGGWLSLDDLRGQAVLISFDYSGCGAECAELSARMQALRTAVAGASPPVQLLTISVDPANDTPAVLQRHAAALGASGVSWRFLTGAPAEIKAIVGEGFRVYYTTRAAGEAGAPIALDQRAVLLDASGQQRAEYDLTTLETAHVLRDLDLLKREQAGSTTWQRPVYEAAHLFVCYPQ